MELIVARSNELLGAMGPQIPHWAPPPTPRRDKGGVGGV